MVSPPLSDSGNPPPRGRVTFASTYQKFSWWCLHLSATREILRQEVSRLLPQPTSIQLKVSPPLSDFWKTSIRNSNESHAKKSGDLGLNELSCAEGVLTSQRIFEKLSAKNEWEIGKRSAELGLNEVFLSWRCPHLSANREKFFLSPTIGILSEIG